MATTSSVIANTSSDRALAKEDHEKWIYPKELFAAYKSAQVHTVKRTVKAKHKRAIVLLAIAALIVGYIVWDVGKAVSPAGGAEGATAGTAASQPQAGGGAFGQSRRKEWESDPNKPGYRTDYARDHLPRFATAPWTAPVFDNRTVTSDPQLICMSSMDGRDVAGDYREPSCTCLTEQGTRVEISQPECRKVARFGPPYNPYRQERPEPSRREFGGVGGSPPTAMASVDAAPSPGATITAPQVTAYGDIGARRIEPATASRW